ncbi:Cell division protein FtsQ [Streptococcus sp. DD10]|uniref:cell division protein FtsQ/DivIB n=1 Tax=Streptococcus sp. DD10 TaxID=1777878 RepID=UPI0007955187|nr:FtsQ-type POTRA domain-containing protein [Streptococcus sp. DD10]KXT73752.1 Cell division protein FtsQ [Streptococcus sp. DD10]
MLAFFFLMTILSLYFITPLGIQKTINVKGNNEVSTKDILTSSAIGENDYTLTTFLSQKAYERNLLASSPWIEGVSMSYQFPTTFTIQIKEYDIIAYEVREGKYYPILINGVVVENAKTPEEKQSKPLVQFSDAEKIRQFVEQFIKMPASLKKEIQSIELTPTNATRDLLTVTMTGEHKVLVPLSDIKRKLSYYETIQAQLTEPSVVDMESGIFSYSQSAATASNNQQNTEASTETNAETNTEVGTIEAGTETSGEMEEKTEDSNENTEQTTPVDNQEFGT